MAESSFITTTAIVCPYCGTQNKVAIYADELRGKSVAYCDVENGGCDEPFAYSIDFSIETVVFKLVKVDSQPLTAES